ncbi:hypothetical protein ACFOQM_12375, partial [Paenibacillus sp. GCM10012307]|nr:hypothetical protein [Paenibacillus roseus]
MAAFGGMQITNRGRTLQAKAQTGTQLKFTRIGIGSGQLGGQIIADLNGLIDPKMFLEIRKLQTRPAGRALVGSYLSNSSVTAGFYFRELAVFALDPDVGEVLYCYANSGSTAEYIPAGGGPDIVEKYIDVITIVQNAPNVSADIDQSLVYATHKDLETLRIEMTQHRTAAVLDHPDKSVTTAKLADKGVTQAKIGDKAVGSGQLADGAATDAVIGSRTISDAEAPTGNDGPPIKLWGWLAYMIKAITGKTSWRTLPAVTLEDANAHINAASPHSGHAVTGRKINTSGGLSGGGDLSADRSLSITDNGVTDAKIGNRTVDPNISTAFSLTGTVTQLLSWITKQLKAITGEANPFDTPAVTLKQAKLKLDELDGKAKESATLQAQLGRGVNKIETDQASPLDGTVYGRTMQNIIPPQRFEANNSAWALSGGTVQYDNTVGNYEIGSASAKVTLSSDSTSFHFSTILPVLPANKHFVVVARYKNGNLSNGLTIGISNAADNLSVETSSRINSTSFATVMRRFKTLKNTPADIIRIGPYADGGEAGQYCWLDAMAIFEISEAEYNIPRAQWDDNRYPYIDGMQSVRGAVIEHPGRNLIDVMSNMSTPTSGDIFGYTGRHSFDFTPSVANRTMYITLPVVPNEIYAMSCDMSANGEFALYSDESSPIALMSYRSTPGAATVGNRTRIRVYFRGNIAGTKVSFANPMLVMGGLDKLPPSFVAREDQRIIIDEVLRSVGPVSDQVNLARKQVTRLIGVWEPSATGTYTLDSYSGVYVPRIAIPADSSKSTLPVMVRYDGLMIRIGAPSTDGPNIVSSYNWGLGT